MSFKDRLKAIREQQGLSQKDLANKVGLQHSAINRYEVRGIMPSFETACKIADALEVPIEAFRQNSNANPHKLEKLAQKALKLPDDKIKTIEQVIEAFLT